MMFARLQLAREWLLVLPLLLLLAVTYWLNQQVQPLPPEPSGKNRHDPDVIVNKLLATTLSQQGTPRFILSAEKMLHYPDYDSTYLDNLQLSSLYPNQPPVYTTARTGEVSSKGNEVFLHDEVKLVRAANETQSEMYLTTTYMHVVPDLGLMDTDRPIEMKDGYNAIQATGMTFNNKTRIMNLLAQVRSQHEKILH